MKKTAQILIKGTQITRLWALCLALWCTASPGETRLEQWVSAPNQALSLHPSGKEVLVSYHPGRISLLALIDTAGRKFTGIYAVPYRGDFIARWLSADELLVAFRPEDICSSDARLVRINLPAARRAQSAEFRSSRGLARGGPADLSVHDSVNRQLPALLEDWGDLERRRWPGISGIEMPADSCPERWAGGRLQLSKKQADHRLLFDPARPESDPEQGMAWLFDGQGQPLANLGSGGQLKMLNGQRMDLSRYPRATLLGLTARGDPLMILEPDSARVFRFRDGDLELYQEDPRNPMTRVRLAPHNDRIVSLESSDESPRRLFLDHRLSDIIRALEREAGSSLVVLDEAGQFSQMLLEAEAGFWLSGPTRLFEAKRGWLDSDASVKIDTRAEISAVDDMPDNMPVQDSEWAALAFLGVRQAGKSTTGNSVPVCNWQRTENDVETLTTLGCAHQTRSWTTRLASESDAARARRLQEMAAFAIGPQLQP